MYGPILPISQDTHQLKYRQNGESFEQAMRRVASALSDNSEHERKFLDILLNQRFLPAGRVQSSIGSARRTTPYNCFVSGTIPDDMGGIMQAAGEAAETMRKGGGIGYDFSTLRPRGALITSLESPASGPVSFMNIFDAVCGTISSAGHRRGAQMGVLRVDHPDIMEFIHAKTNQSSLTNFNISVGVTDEFMECVLSDTTFDLRFEGKVHKRVRARDLFEAMLQNTWDWAEPGILFLDRIKDENNLWYCEEIAATNPCGEQPLPPYGACLLGSFNMTQYVNIEERRLDVVQYLEDIPVVIRAMDNIIDRAEYPLTEQQIESEAKRRMGIGVTGVANAIEALGYPYGSHKFNTELHMIMLLLSTKSYLASVQLAIEKGAFPLYDKRLLESGFMRRQSKPVQEMVARHGLRNSHLTSIAPTGTISLCADNVSSGIEPVFSYSLDRTIQKVDGPIYVELSDYGYREWGVKGKTAEQCTVEDHLGVLGVASRLVDSAVSKTCNVGDNVTFDQFKDVYVKAWKLGAKGCTTFRAAGKRFGILNAKPKSEENEGAACFIDPATGAKKCDE